MPSATCRRTAINGAAGASVRKGVWGRRAAGIPRRRGTVAARSVSPRPAVTTDAPSGVSSGPVQASHSRGGTPHARDDAGIGGEGAGVQQDDDIRNVALRADGPPHVVRSGHGRVQARAGIRMPGR